MAKRALITGVTGQDGSYLAESLCANGYEVWGLIRGQDNPRVAWLKEIVPGINLVSGDLIDEQSLHAAVAESLPDEIYNFAAISSPNLAWRQPVLTGEVTALGALRLFEAVRVQAPTARVLQASSIATHGPYGAAKLFAHTVAHDYRSRGLHISCAVFGGHHSPRRGESFFARKVTAAVARIQRGEADRLDVGSLTRVQDWGRATDFVSVLPRIMDLQPDDYAMSTNDPHSSREWVEEAFRVADMDWHQYVQVNEALGNVTDVPTLTAAPDPRLEWEPDCDFSGLIRWMVEAEK